MQSYKDLQVWQKSIELVLLIYKTTSNFPDSEKFGLVSQMNRCSVSMPSNIAEGWGRKSDKEKSHFLRVAYGSGLELETQILIAYKLGFMSDSLYDEVSGMLTEILKMINGLMNKLSADS